MRDPATDIRHFDTSDISLILARITRGLQRAQVLEERLVRNAARLDAPRRPQTTPATHKPRVTQSAVECSQPSDSPLARLPTAEQIAADVRRRPIGAVLADICRDLGVLPSHPAMARIERGHHVQRRQPRPPGEGDHRPGRSSFRPGMGRDTHTPIAAPALPITRRHRPTLKLCPGRPAAAPMQTVWRRRRLFDTIHATWRCISFR